MHELQKRTLISQDAKKWNVIQSDLFFTGDFPALRFLGYFPYNILHQKKKYHTSDYIRLEENHNVS